MIIKHMQAFAGIYQAALDRTGGEKALKALLPVPRTKRELKALPDAFFLSEMTHRIFQAGLNRKIIDDKWSAFEAVFHQFDIEKNRMASDEHLERLMVERRIVRHWGKIQSVRHNARAIDEFNERQDGFVAQLADWPADNIVGLWEILNNNFKQLGGASGSYFLRRVRKDTFLLTEDVVRALMYWGAIDAKPKTATQKRHIQDCMNNWYAESNKPYCQISMILARSVD